MVTIKTDNQDSSHWYNRMMNLRKKMERAGFYAEADRMELAVRKGKSSEDAHHRIDGWEERTNRAIMKLGPNPNLGFSRTMPK